MHIVKNVIMSIYFSVVRCRESEDRSAVRFCSFLDLRSWTALRKGVNRLIASPRSFILHLNVAMSACVALAKCPPWQLKSQFPSFLWWASPGQSLMEISLVAIRNRSGLWSSARPPEVKPRCIWHCRRAVCRAMQRWPR